VRRAKLYYLRGLTGKAARITERRLKSTKADAKTTPKTAAKEAPSVDTDA
jgi:large subunit ribosomal protein L19